MSPGLRILLAACIATPTLLYIHRRLLLPVLPGHIDKPVDVDLHIYPLFDN